MMHRTLTHDEAFAELPLYLLGVLDADEAQATADHLDHCPFCQRERVSLEQVLGLLGTSVADVAPPPELRARVLSQITPTWPAASSSLELPEMKIRRLPAWARAGFAVAAAVILLLALSTALLYRNLSDTRSDLTATQSQMSQEVELLAHPARTISMAANNAEEGYGTLYVDADGMRALMVVEDLPPTPINRVYQIWLVRGDARDSAGVFTVDATGRARVLINAPSTISSYQSMGITNEPGPGGSPGPTTPRVVGCSLV